MLLSPYAMMLHCFRFSAFDVTRLLLMLPFEAAARRRGCLRHVFTLITLG